MFRSNCFLLLQFSPGNKCFAASLAKMCAKADPWAQNNLSLLFSGKGELHSSGVWQHNPDTAWTRACREIMLVFQGKSSLSNYDLQHSWKCHFLQKNKAHYKKAVWCLGTPSNVPFSITNTTINTETDLCGVALYLTRAIIMPLNEAEFCRK